MKKFYHDNKSQTLAIEDARQKGLVVEVKSKDIEDYEKYIGLNTIIIEQDKKNVELTVD